MIKIAICDDHIDTAKKLESAIMDISFERDLDLEISLYSSGESLIDDLSTDAYRYHIVILDIYLQSTNGLKIGDTLRNNNPKVDIIYASTSEEHIFDAYASLPSYYIRKNKMSYNEIKSIIKKIVLRKLNSNNGFLNIKVRGDSYHIDTDDISYIEVVNRTIYIKNRSNQLIIKFNGKLKDVELLLKSSFVRVHRSYIINIHDISIFQSGQLTLSSGIVIPVGRKYKDYVKNEYSNYLTSKII